MKPICVVRSESKGQKGGMRGLGCEFFLLRFRMDAYSSGEDLGGD